MTGDLARALPKSQRLIIKLFQLSVLCACATPAAAHDLYTGLTSPDGHTCCGGQPGGDCSQRPSRITADGSLEILMEGRWWPATDPRWYLGNPPDGGAGAYGCMMHYDKQPRCVWAGQGM
jgi:hypothetical protein